WLVRALESAGAGFAHEYITALQKGQKNVTEGFQSDGLPGFVEALKAQQSGSCYGLATPWNSLAWLAGQVKMKPGAVLDELRELMAPATLIYLKRQDVLAQAISHYILSVTGRAHSFE